MFRRTALAASALLLSSALLLASCTGGASPDPSTGGGEADPDATLTVGLVLEPTNLDIRRTTGAAIEQVLVDNVYQGLVTRTETNEIVPSLASEYEVSADGLTYTFTLNEGVTFHDGSELTTDDVVTSLQQVKDDPEIDGNLVFQNVASIQAPDASTVVLTLTAPNQNFLFTLTGPAGLVFRADDTTDLQTAANGTGPFVLEEWTQGDSIVLGRYDEYWGDPAGVAEVVLQYIPDFTAGVNAALDGSLDVLTAVLPDLVSQFDGVEDFELTRGRTTDEGTLAFNNQREPLNDERVREALRLAVDHVALAEATGLGTPLGGPIPELDPGYEDLTSTIDFDPERARQLLAEAGVEDLELTLTIPSFYGARVPQVLVSSYNDIGVTLEVNSVEFATWASEVIRDKNYDLSFVLHVEPRDFGNYANPEYYFGYNNPEVQALYAEAMATLDADESAELLAEAARIVSEEDAADWLYSGITTTAVGAGVSGFPVDSVNSRINLADVTVSQ